MLSPTHVTSILHLFQPKYYHFGLTNNDISTLLQLALISNFLDNAMLKEIV